jgi:predicted secreted protein
VLAYVPADEPNQFFVMTQQQTTQLIQNELNRLKRADNYPVTGFVWKLALPHHNAWGILPK